MGDRVNTMNIADLAEQNMRERFVDNPCRGIVLGLDNKGNGVQLSWIMGRSANSQNRVYCQDGLRVYTDAADLSKVEDPSLIIYDAMDSAGKAHVVSNGHQTNYIVDALDECIPADICNALSDKYCEPDAPIFTPRISGVQVTDDNACCISILKSSPWARDLWLATIDEHGLRRQQFEKDGRSQTEATRLYNVEVSRLSGLDYHKFPTIHQLFDCPLENGFGYCVTTYRPGHVTLDSFEGEPFVVPMNGSIDEIMGKFWDTLESEWRVAIAGKYIGKDGASHVTLINRFEMVE